MGVYLLGGYGIVRALLPRQRVLTRLWLGGALGLLLMMWLPALLAFAFDFTVKAHLLALVPLCAAVLGIHYGVRSKAPLRRWEAQDKRLLILLLAVALPLTLLGGYLQIPKCEKGGDE